MNSLALLPYLKRGCSCLEMNEGLKTGEHNVQQADFSLIMSEGPAVSSFFVKLWTSSGYTSSVHLILMELSFLFLKKP